MWARFSWEGLQSPIPKIMISCELQNGYKGILRVQRIDEKEHRTWIQACLVQTLSTSVVWVQGFAYLPWPRFPCRSNRYPNYIGETWWKQSPNTQNKLGLESWISRSKIQTGSFRNPRLHKEIQGQIQPRLGWRPDTETTESVGDGLWLITLTFHSAPLPCSLFQNLRLHIQQKIKTCH